MRRPGSLDLWVDFERGGTFACPECGREGCKAYDTSEKRWRHLDFFQHRTFVHARVPRVECPECGVKQVEVPWARPGSGFTFWFESLVMALVCEMPVNAAARLVGEHDTRLWRILRHYVAEARAAADFSEVRSVGLDEKASRRGQNYITLFADLDEAQLLFATEGRDASVFGRFRLELLRHGGRPEEQKERPELKRTRYLWLKNRGRLNAAQQKELDELLRPSRSHLKTARAYRLKLALQDFWALPPILAEEFLKRWYYWATHSRLAPMIRVARTIRKHASGVLRWFRSRVSNGMLEAMNSLLQAAKARARGYRTTENLIAMAYLVSGKLDFKLPI